MDHFSIDDVHEPFQADMQGVLDALHTRLADHGVAARLAAAAQLSRGFAPLAEQLEDGCHTIVGSSSLVGAQSLVTGANALRQVIIALRDASQEAEAAAQRAEQLTMTARRMVEGLGQLLQLELGKHRAEADALAKELGPRQAPITPSSFTFAPLLTSPGDDHHAESGFSFADHPTNEEPLIAVISDDDHDAVALAPVPASPVASSPDAELIAPELMDAFRGEATDLLDGMERLTLDLEHHTQPRLALQELFRLYHTLKGAANTVGLTTLGAFVHRVEDLIESTTEHLDEHPNLVSLASVLIEAQRTMRAWLDSSGAIPDAAVQIAHEALDRASATQTIPASTTTVVASAPAASTASSETSATMVEFLHDAEPISERQDRRFLRVAADHLDHLMGLTGELVQGRARLDTRVSALSSLRRDLRTSRERLQNTIDTFRERYEFSGLDGSRHNTATASPAPSRLHSHFTALELDHYDDIHILSRSLGEIGSDISELQAQINQVIGAFSEDAERFGRVVGGIQGEITRARMVPIGQLFTRLRMAVRDAATRVDKSVRVVWSGEDSALDKAIIDGLLAPLQHLVRNAVAHGIESSEARQNTGKHPEGVLTLAARQESGQLILLVSDDGAGLDLVALRQRGSELGLVDPMAPLESDAVRELVFAPGLSTNATISELSGRGFGCDVARRDIQRLGGTIAVQSRSGQGVTFTITLPLTLAINRALMIRHGDQPYAVPMAFVERILDPESITVTTSGGVTRFAHGNHQIILLDLGNVLGLESHRRSGGAILLLRVGTHHWGLRIDQLLNQTDIVVNTLGELLTGHPLFAGVTLTGSGELVPILDLAGVISDARRLPSAPLIPATPRVESRLERPRVLVVDDSISIRKVAESHLRALGVDTVLAVDGEDALTKLRQERFDLVFTDLEMPRLNGYDLIRELRFIPAHRSTPVVVITSRTGDKHRRLAEAVGANGYLTKPFTAAMLADALATWMQPRSGLVRS